MTEKKDKKIKAYIDVYWHLDLWSHDGLIKNSGKSGWCLQDSVNHFHIIYCYTIF